MALRRNLSRDLGDFFGFEVTRIVPLQEEAKGSRVHVRASLGPKTFAVFHIDVVVRGETLTGSSRIKDLVDIALIATTQQISGPALRAAILAGTVRRNLSLPDAFAVPDEAVWRRGYPRSAADAPGPTPSFDEAVSLACALLNPVLKGPVSGNWDPAAASWNSHAR